VIPYNRYIVSLHIYLPFVSRDYDEWPSASSGCCTANYCYISNQL